ncbi:MAG TPA: type II toxin-antitoxin system Phd/YefM family antitoxin [Phycisphaerae bacterium]|jgi:PHD/YefM family antitoxin component YafN of YafNO toxin-antitoxin module
MPTGTLDISDARKQLNTLDRRLREHRVIYITRHNKQAFVVVDSEYFSALLETLEVLADPEAIRMLQESIADIRAGRLHDHEDVKRELL